MPYRHANASAPHSDTTFRQLARQAPILDDSSEHQLLVAVSHGDQAALDKLLRSHMRLVWAVARDYTRFGCAMDDLVSEGYLGLVQAARRFDSTRTTRFATYAALWVRAYIREFTLRNRRIVPMPSSRNARKVIARLRTTERELIQQNGCEPSADEVAVALGVTESDIHMVDRAFAARDVPLVSETDHPTLDLPDQQPSPEEQVSRTEIECIRSSAINHALCTLDGRERQIVETHLISDDKSSLAAIGQKMGLSRERVRQLEMRARRKLREILVPEVAA